MAAVVGSALLACHDEKNQETPSCSAPPVSIADSGGVVRTISRAEYRDKLVALWLAESVANWTGLLTEGARVRAPFFTDTDWGSDQGNVAIGGSTGGRIDFNFFDPWPSDDDTDIEFIYVTAMHEKGCPSLTSDEIRDAWIRHTEPGQFVWVSNRTALSLMEQVIPVLPPSTSLLAANDQALMIDAQLTTEIFGAIAPGMPRLALEIADLPIGVTASGYAAHAAQFYVTLYSLAAVCDADLTGEEKVEWLVTTARRVIPDGSKAADVVDFVLQDYADNPDRGAWERTRDRVATAFQVEAEQNGYRYLEWYESPVNLATGVIALLYGANDLRRTIQIGTLSGWDSDNGTATMGGLLGLLNGAQYVLDAFATERLSMRYFIGRTRVGFDHQDVSFQEIADRMLPIVEMAVEGAGGTVYEDRYELPPVDFGALDARAHNPRFREHGRSMNNAEGAGATVVVEGGVPEHPGGEAIAPDTVIVDGLETDGSGRDRRLRARDGSQFPDGAAEPRCTARSGRERVSVSVTWRQAGSLAALRLFEGSASSAGGWLEDVEVEVRSGGAWTPVALQRAYEPGTTRAFEAHVLTFQQPLTTDGIRVTGVPGGSSRYFTICELDGLRAL